MRPESRAAAGSRPITARKAWLLPAPDSPTTPRHSPGATVRFKSRTAYCSPAAAAYATLSDSMERTGIARALPVPGAPASAARIERVTQCISEQIETEQEQREQARGTCEQPGCRAHLRGAVANQASEARERLLDAEPEEAQEALEEDHLRHCKGRVDDHRAREIWNDVARHDPRRARAARHRRLDERPARERECLPAHDPRHGDPADRADSGEQYVRVAAAEKCRERDDEQQVRERIETVHDPHHHCVRAASGKAGHRAPCDPDHDAHAGCRETDRERQARSVEHAYGEVAAEPIGAVAARERPEHCREQNGEQNPRPELRGTSVSQPRPEPALRGPAAPRGARCADERIGFNHGALADRASRGADLPRDSPRG